MSEEFNLNKERVFLKKWLIKQLGKKNALLIWGLVTETDKEFIKRLKVWDYKELKGFFEYVWQLSPHNFERKLKKDSVDNIIRDFIKFKLNARIDKLSGEELKQKLGGTN